MWTRYLNHKISRETNKFMKEPPDILGPCFWYIEIHRVWPIFGWLNHYIHPNKAILSVKLCINVSRNVQNAPNIILYGETPLFGGKEPRKCIPCEITMPKQVKLCINVSRNVQNAPNIILYGETPLFGGKEPRKCIPCEITMPKQNIYTKISRLGDG